MLLEQAIKTGLPFAHGTDEDYLVVSPEGYIVPEAHSEGQVSFHKDELTSSNWKVRTEDGTVYAEYTIPLPLP